ncbi:MAG TPA: hypothetical protein VG937_06980 [Polyangiaceae bacterium]|nr:hypothetical protein [Polyangiaceae bacterium]
MKPACTRLFEAEALRDGRLTGTELTSFQRHLGVCATCASEVNSLDALAKSLQAHAAERADSDELHVRRERTRLLAAFDASLAPPERASRVPGWVFGLAATLALSIGSFAYLRARPASPPPVAPNAVVVRADSTAVWSRESTGPVEKIVLSRGALSVQVDHTLGHRRLLILLPDGELEDIGTTFAVSADGGHTTRVTVQDGSVVLRIHGQPPLAIGAGDSWSPAPRPGASVCLDCGSPPAATATSGQRAAAVPPVKTAPLSPAAAIPSASKADAALDFREAMAALASGDNSRAATRFGAFLVAHPGDRRSEDAAYLRVIALQRAASPMTKQAALDYFRRFPAGFRRAEVEPLAR